ncbi:MAG: hypothetical protein D3904_08645, partial [Candidatus Electrothrix sp. EH2]|nr:hypothetical protein [Candidatus Electrothrix sp. EH2]
MHRRLLPIGIQTFRKIRERDYYYVDKTPLIQNLIESGGYYFLARPRQEVISPPHPQHTPQ